MVSREYRNTKIIILLFVLVTLLFLGLNYRQLYSILAIRSETKRLTSLAENAPQEFQNPEPIKDNFDEKLPLQFWEFIILNGSGKSSNESPFHSVAMTFDHGLTIYHYPDPVFKYESSDISHKPSAGQYNNASLIGGRGFFPTPSSDVVLKFTTQVDEKFYGTAGVIFQPVGILQKDGLFVNPFDMFGFAVAGQESSINGVNGPLCYLALSWIPVKVDALNVDIHTRHTYEVRLRWISKTEWLGIVKVDNDTICQMPMPVFGPVDVHVWSDNVLAVYKPRRWWEIAPTTDLKFQDGGDKQFHLEMIQIFAETR